MSDNQQPLLKASKILNCQAITSRCPIPIIYHFNAVWAWEGHPACSTQKLLRVWDQAQYVNIVEKFTIIQKLNVTVVQKCRNSTKFTLQKKDKKVLYNQHDVPTPYSIAPVQ